MRVDGGIVDDIVGPEKPCFLSDEIPILTANLNQGWITTVEILELVPEVVGDKHLFVLLDWCLLHVGRLGSWGLLFAVSIEVGQCIQSLSSSI